MENIILVIHLILAVCLIGVVLLQRSEGGGLGMGGGGGGGAMSGRQAATALGRLTWIFAVCFLATSVTLTIFAAQNSAGSSLLDDLGGLPAVEGEADAPISRPDLSLPPIGTDGPALPPASE